MKNIAIITDTDCSLPVDIAGRYGIRQVPITVHFGEETYHTGVDIDDRRMVEMVEKRGKLPTTSAPSPHAFATAYESAFTDGANAVICICVSSKVSATYGSAVTACENFPGREIHVVDSLSLSMGQGFMALAAAEAAQAGASAEQILAEVRELGQRQHLYAVLATLKYLAMSGRVGKVAAGIADTINIKPVLTIRDGKLDLLEKIRTRKKAIDRMLELGKLSLNGKPVERAAIIHVNHPEGARELQDLLCAALPIPEPVITAEFTPGLSVHAGAGVVGFVLQSVK